MTESSSQPIGEAFQRQNVEIPRYDPSDQWGIDEMTKMYPDWQQNHSEEDPDLILFDFTRTQEERRMAAETGIIRYVMATESLGLEKAIKQIPREVGRHFQAHGIAGKSGSSSFELNELLTNGIDSERMFYTTELDYNVEAGAAIGADMPFTDGGLVTVFGMDERVQGQGGELKYVIVGEHYLKCFDAMQAKYPNLKFIPWHDAPQFFIDQVNEAEGTQYEALPIDYPDTYDPEAAEVNLPYARTVAIGSTAITNEHWDGTKPDIW